MNIRPQHIYNDVMLCIFFFFFLSGFRYFGVYNYNFVSLLKLTTTLQKLTRQRKLTLVAGIKIIEPQQCVYLKSEKAKAMISLSKPWTLNLYKNQKCKSHHTHVHVNEITQICPWVLRQIVFYKIKTCIILCYRSKLYSG